MNVEKVRASYDTVARAYAQTWPELSAESPLEIALLNRFADELLASGGRVTDVGSGPGRITSFLSSRGLDVDGIDLSPGMVDVARTDFPALKFEVGSMLDLPIEDHSRTGILAWYSTIHMPVGELPRAYGEFARVLVPGGLLLLGFHIGDDTVHVTRSYGQEVDAELFLFDPEKLDALLVDAGFRVEVKLVRAPTAQEKRPQGFLLARTIA